MIGSGGTNDFDEKALLRALAAAGQGGTMPPILGVPEREAVQCVLLRLRELKRLGFEEDANQVAILKESAELIAGLALFGDQLFEPLVQELYDPRLRSYAASVLSKMGSFAIPRITSLLSVGEPTVRATATSILAEMGIKSSTASEILRKHLLSDPDPTVRREVVAALVRIDQPRQWIALADVVLADPDVWVQTRFIEAVAGYPKEASPALPHLARSLEHAELFISASNTILTLAKYDALGPSKVPCINSLISALRHDSSESAGWNSIADTLIAVGIEAIWPVVVGLSNQNDLIRSGCHFVMRRMIEEEGPFLPVIQTIARMLNSPQREDVLHACKAVKVVGSAAIDLIPTLQALSHTNDQMLRQAAQNAISAVAGEGRRIGVSKYIPPRT